MSYLISPELTLKIWDKEYTLSPSFECLKKIQHYFKEDIIKVMELMPKTSFEHQAKMIEIAIDDYGTTPPKIEKIEEWIVDEVGIVNIRNIMEAWLLVITSPKKEREVTQAQVGKFLNAENLKPFLGSNTKKCASDI